MLGSATVAGWPGPICVVYRSTVSNPVAKAIAGSKICVGFAEPVTPDMLPEEARDWPVEMQKLWLALAMGRKWTESSEAAGLDPKVARARVRADRKMTTVFLRVMNWSWRPLMEPARDLLGIYIQEGLADDATDGQKDRGLKAVKEVLRQVRSTEEVPAAPQPVVNVNVSGDGASVGIDMGGLLAERTPLPSRTVGGLGGEWDVEAEVVTVESTQPRRARTSSQRTAAERDKAKVGR